MLGRILLFRREFGLAEQHLERALSLNRNDADSLVQMAMAFGYLGRGDRALELYRRALSLNPYHDPWYQAYGMVPAFVLEDWEMVLECGGSTPIDTMVDLPVFLAIAHLRCGEPQAAREHVGIYLEQFAQKIATGREIEPGEALRWVLHINPFRDAAHTERMATGLRDAGLEGSLPAPAPIVPQRDRRAFRPLGSLWQVSFAGRDAHLPHLKGCVDIATLLSQPRQEIHCNELMGGDAAAAGAGDDAIDDQARAAYRARIAELQRELAEAQEDNDLGRSEKLGEELETLSEHLSKALGLGGRARKLGAPTERARSAVTWRIRSALKKLDEVHPDLGAHLRDSIQTGTFCSYSPKADGKDWEL